MPGFLFAGLSEPLIFTGYLVPNDVEKGYAVYLIRGLKDAYHHGNL